MAKLAKADGCHIGQKDTDFIRSRKIMGKNKYNLVKLLEVF